MSRSYKKTPVFAYTVEESDKQDKIICNKRFRRIEKVAIAKCEEPPTDKREVSEFWMFAKDGKHYNPNASKKEMSK